MIRGEEKGRPKSRVPLIHMLRYLAGGRIPQRVAKANIAEGFKHNRSAPAYSEKEVTSINKMASALGYRNHTAFYTSNEKLSTAAEPLLLKLYSIKEDSKCWRHFCDNEVD